MKMCPKCLIEKPFTDFCKDNSKKDGLHCRCKLCRNEQNKVYHEENKDKRNTRARKYKKENKRLVADQHNAYEKRRKKRDPNYKLRKNISSAIWRGLKKLGHKKDGRTWSKLPYSPQQLREHIESQWVGEKSWMTWENHGPYVEGKQTWNIDHIEPQSSFIFSSMNDKEFQECWALSNLQPLETLDNIKKGNKIV